MEYQMSSIQISMPLGALGAVEVWIPEESPFIETLQLAFDLYSKAHLNT